VLISFPTITSSINTIAILSSSCCSGSILCISHKKGMQ
jgi:hypothetical protein